MLRGLLKHYWKKDLSAKAAAEEICAIEGESIIHLNTATQPISGRLSVVDDDALLECVNQDPHATTRDFSAVVGASNATVAHLKNLSIRNLRPSSDPYDLTEVQAQQQVDIGKILLKNLKDDRFWKKITSDEK